MNTDRIKPVWRIIVACDYYYYHRSLSETFKWASKSDFGIYILKYTISIRNIKANIACYIHLLNETYD